MMNKYGFIFAILLLSSTLMAAPLIYVPMGNENMILIIDGAKDEIIGRIDELENAHGLATSMNTEFLIAGSMQPLVSDGASPRKPAAVSDEEHAAHHAGTKDDGNAPSQSKSFLSIVHPQHGHVMHRVPVRSLTHHTAVSPNGKFAVAVHSGAAGISIVDLDKKITTASIDTGLRPNYAVFTQDGDRLYVSNSGANTVSEIDTKNWKIVREFKTGKAPEHMVLGLGDRMLYVANKDAASVSAIELASGQIKQTFAVGDKPHGIDVSGDGRWLYVASKKSGVINRIDLVKDEHLTIDLKPAPYHLAYWKDFDKLYVSSRKEPKIWVLDGKTLALKKTINLERGVAHQMVMRK